MTESHLPAWTGTEPDRRDRPRPATRPAPGPRPGNRAAGHAAELPAIELAGVAKEFQARGEVVTAVRGLDLAIVEGEFFSLLGPSGCGKTTTMRMIAGFEEPTRGAIRLHGADVTGVPPNKRDVNMVFQSYALFPHMSVFENVAFGLRRKKAAKGEITRRVGEMLEIVDLGGRGERRPKELSGGQQQRVALARALVNRPRALLLDEPLGALDLKLRQAMQVELKRIQREVGITFVYVTHDQDEALTMSDRIAVMNDGAIEHLGTPAGDLRAPQDAVRGGLHRHVEPAHRHGNPGGRRPRRHRGEPGRADRRAGQRARAWRPAHRWSSPSARRRSRFPPRGRPVPAACCAVPVTEVVYLGTSTNFSVTTTTGADIVVFQQNSAAAG